MKKFIAREILWLVATFILALPLGLVFLWLLGYTSEGVSFASNEKNYLLGIYLVGYILSFIGIYIVRLVSAMISVLSAPEEA